MSAKEMQIEKKQVYCFEPFVKILNHDDGKIFFEST